MHIDAKGIARSSAFTIIGLPVANMKVSFTKFTFHQNNYYNQNSPFYKLTAFMQISALRIHYPALYNTWCLFQNLWKMGFL